MGQMHHFSHARLPWFVCGGLLAETGLGEDSELVGLMQNTFFNTISLSCRSFALSSSNSEVTVSIANGSLSLCFHALWFSCCFASAWPQHWAEQGSSFWTGLPVVPDVQGEKDDVTAIAG